MSNLLCLEMKLLDDTIFIRICGIITCIMMLVLSVMMYKGYIEIVRLVKDDIHETEKLKKSIKYYDSEQLDYYDRRITK